MTEVKGKDITELIASGREKLASVPSGGGAVAVAAAPAGGAPSGGAAPAAEAKEEKKVEEKEESDDVSFKIEQLLIFVNSRLFANGYMWHLLSTGYGFQLIRLSASCVQDIFCSS